MDKKGVSGIITVVILIALVLVAIGIVWAVAFKLIEQQTKKIQQANDCNDITHLDYKILSVCVTSFEELKLSLQNGFVLNDNKKYSPPLQLVGTFNDETRASWMIGDCRCSDVRLKGESYGVYIPLLVPGKAETYYVNISGLGSVSEIEVYPVVNDKRCNPIKYSNIGMCENGYD